jgi:hypothetical protein
MMFYLLIDYMFCFVLDLISDYMIGFVDYMMVKGVGYPFKTPKHQTGNKSLNKQTNKQANGQQAGISNSTDGIETK